MRYLLFSLFIFSIASCSTTGVYYKGGGFAYDQLTLKKDQTFIYDFFMDVGGSNLIEGRWIEKGNKIVLNSYKKSTIKPNAVSYHYIKELKQKTITIQYLELGAWGVIVSLNNGEEIDTAKGNFDQRIIKIVGNWDAMVIYPKIDSIWSIRILKNSLKNTKVPTLINYEFNIEQNDSNLICVNAQPINYIYGIQTFSNMVWLKKGNKIFIDRDSSGNYNKKLFLKRDLISRKSKKK